MKGPSGTRHRPLGWDGSGSKLDTVIFWVMAVAWIVSVAITILAAGFVFYRGVSWTVHALFG
jgi:hypothetical protein